MVVFVVGVVLGGLYRIILKINKNKNTTKNKKKSCTCTKSSKLQQQQQQQCCWCYSVVDEPDEYDDDTTTTFVVLSTHAMLSFLIFVLHTMLHPHASDSTATANPATVTIAARTSIVTILVLDFFNGMIIGSFGGWFVYECIAVLLYLVKYYYWSNGDIDEHINTQLSTIFEEEENDEGDKGDEENQVITSFRCYTAETTSVP